MMDSTGLTAIAAIVLLVIYAFHDKFGRWYEFRGRMNKIPGPDFGIPFFGTVYELMKIPQERRLTWFKNIADQHKDGFIRTWVGFSATAHIHKPQHVEIILRSNTEITKSTVYDYLKPWLGLGLITSTGPQWFHDRKLITPAFHFSILEDFAEVMIDKAAILNSCIEREIKIHGQKPIDIFELGVRCALDIICETAMGTNVHAQEAIENDYINSIHSISTGAVNRFFRPWLKYDWIYNKTAAGKSYQKSVETAHDLCTRVINRKQEERKSGVPVNDESAEIDGKRKRKAFMDLLLEANEKEENPLTTTEIRDQVNTFMFAGHDTTGALISWTLFCLGNEPDIQKKVHEELDEVLGDADDRTTLKKIPNLKYLERVIKEVLRLYPSVTVISRNIINDLKIDEYTVPAGATLSIQIYQLHRDPAIWPDPERFDPDRFLPENIRDRHTYAYVPFSAGPRNCIGQKYAMLEAKVTLTQILRNYSFKSVETHSTIKMYSDIILRPVDGIFVNITKRSTKVK